MLMAKAIRGRVLNVLLMIFFTSTGLKVVIDMTDEVLRDEIWTVFETIRDAMKEKKWWGYNKILGNK